MAQIYYKKAYDMISKLKIFKISDKIINFNTKSLENWKVKLTAKRQIQAEVKI